MSKFMNTTCMALIIGLLVWSPVFANIEYASETLANEGNWQSLYNHNVEIGFDTLDGTGRYVLVASAHLSNNNQVGYDLRKKLTDADLENLNHWLPNPTIAYMGPGEALLYAQIREICGEYLLAQDYCERGFAELEKMAENTSSMKDYEINRMADINSKLLGMYAVVGMLAQQESAGRGSLGEMFRLMNEIETSAEAMGIDLDSILADTSVAIADAKDSVAVEVTDDTMGEEVLRIDTEQAAIMENLFKQANDNSLDALAFVQFHYGNFLALSGRDQDALSQYKYATSSDKACNLYWKKWLEKETDTKNIEVTGGMWKLYAKETKTDTIPIMHMNDCSIAIGKSSAAVKEATKFLKAHPNSGYATAQRARAYYEMKDYAKATEDANTAVALDNTNYEAWFVLAKVGQQNSDPKTKEYFVNTLMHSPKELQVHREAQAALKGL